MRIMNKKRLKPENIRNLVQMASQLEHPVAKNIYDEDLALDSSQWRDRVANIPVQNSYGALLEEGPDEQENGVLHNTFNDISAAYNGDIPLGPTKIHKHKATHDFGVGTETCEASCGCDIKTDDRIDDIFRFFTRKSINKVQKKKKSIKTYSRLVNFLRCKFFMRMRDHNLINTMVNDARVWMIKNDFKCESDEDFFVMTQSIIVAFMVNEQEMTFRALLKNKDNWENTAHLNKTLAGNLGKISPMNKPMENSFIGKFLPNLSMPKTSALVV